jgi:protein phosphatase 1G
MGNKELNLAEPITNKIFKSYENDKIRVGICLMQGWRKTMEDISLALPNFDGHNSLFGIFDGHGGSIVSQFAACNIDEIIKNSKYYQRSNYGQSLIDSFVLLDELLKNGRINRFLKKIKNFQKNTKNINGAINSIINNEILKGNIKNDPNTDYLFFCSSYLDNEINLKYKYPDLHHYIKVKNNLNYKHTTDAININNNEYEHNMSSPHLKFLVKRCNSLRKSSIKKLKTHDIYLNKIKHSFIHNPIENENILEAEDIAKSNTKTKLEKSVSFKFLDESDSPSFIANDIGTTANVLLLKNNCAYVANVGDSLSVMYKKKKAIKMNKEHKTTMEKEFTRIVKGGGTIKNFRINGKLNITRSIGDLNYKNKNKKFKYEQNILAIPEVYKYSLDEVDFIVMGSDGFWDYGEDIQTICDHIYDELKKNQKRDLCDLIGSMFDKALAKANSYLRGTDNMSCIIIQFIK